MEMLCFLLGPPAIVVKNMSACNCEMQKVDFSDSFNWLLIFFESFFSIPVKFPVYLQFGYTEVSLICELHFKETKIGILVQEFIIRFTQKHNFSVTLLTLLFLSCQHMKSYPGIS